MWKIFGFLICSLLLGANNGKNESFSFGRIAKYSKSLKAGGTCDMICNAAQVDNSNGMNWLVPIEGGIFLSFNANYNFVAIFNFNLKMAMILDMRGYIGTFNVATGAAIITHTKSGNSVCIKAGIITEFSLQKSYYLAFQNAYNVLDANKSKVGPSININISLNFDLRVLIDGLGNNSSIATIFKNRSQLVTSLADFQILFTNISKAFVSNTIAYITYTKASIFAPMLNIVTAKYELTLVLLNLYNTIVNKLCGNFIPEIFARVRTAVKQPSSTYQNLTNLNIVLNSISMFTDDMPAALINYDSNIIPSYNEKNSVIGTTASRAIWLKLDHSWGFDIALKTTANIVMAFNVDQGSLSFLDKEVGLSAVFYIKTTLFAIYNTSTGVGLAYQSAINKGCFINANSDAIKKAYDDCTFSKAIRLISQNIFNLNLAVFNSSSSSFNMQQFMLGKSTNATLNANFAYVLAAAKAIGYSDANRSTPFDIIRIIFDKINISQFESMLIGITVNFFQGLASYLGTAFTDQLYTLIVVAMQGNMYNSADVNSVVS